MGFFDSNSRTSNDAAQVGQSGEGDLPVNINLSNLRLHKSPNSDIITNVTLSDFGAIDGAFDFAGNAFDEATALVDDTLQAGIEASIAHLAEQPLRAALANFGLGESNHLGDAGTRHDQSIAVERHQETVEFLGNCIHASVTPRSASSREIASSSCASWYGLPR